MHLLLCWIVVLVQESVIAFDDNEDVVEQVSARVYVLCHRKVILSIQAPLNVGKWIVKSC